MRQANPAKKQPGSTIYWLNRARTALRFGALSIASFSINLGLTIGLHEGLGISAAAAFAIAIAVVYVLNFVGMRFFVFPQKAKSGQSVIKQATAFLITSALFRVFDYGAFLLLNGVFGVYYIGTIVLVSGISFVTKFLFYRRWVFGGSQNQTPSFKTQPRMTNV